MVPKKTTRMQQAMKKTMNTTSGGGVHTRWSYEDDYSEDEVNVASSMISMKYGDDRDAKLYVSPPSIGKTTDLASVMTNFSKTEEYKKIYKEAYMRAYKSAYSVVYDNEYKSANKKVVSDNSTNKNYEIAYALLKLAIQEEKKCDYWREMIYTNAAESIRKLDYAITSGKEVAKGPKKIKGIGDGIAKLIDEYLETGKMTVTDYNMTITENNTKMQKKTTESKELIEELNIKKCSNGNLYFDSEDEYESEYEWSLEDEGSDSDWCPGDE